MRYNGSMTSYPNGNPGATPVDTSSPVGQFRLLSRNMTYTEYDPVVPGFGNFDTFSDGHITGLLLASGDSVNRALMHLYLSLSSDAAAESVNIKDMDLAIDKTKKAADYRSLALMYGNLADKEDRMAADIFDLVPTSGSGEVLPELTSPIYGRVYTWGKVL